MPKFTLEDPSVLTVPNTLNCPATPTCNVLPTFAFPIILRLVDIIVPFVSKLPTRILPVILPAPLTFNAVNVPTEVMLGCAAFATVNATFEFVELVANVAVFAVSTLKFATFVVDVTVNGAVPFATFDINLLL